MNRARYRELSKLIDGEEGDVDDIVYAEFDALEIQARVEEFQATHPLKCCSAIQRFPVIAFYVRFPEAEENEPKLENATTHWWAFADPDGPRPPGVQANFGPRPEAKFCPYCATPVPKMRRKAETPPDIVQASGGQYCANCDERLMGCRCLPYEAAFEPEPT